MSHDKKSLLINQVHLKHFRCFSEETVDLGKPLILIEGQNGSGKTSFLEALYYACYLHSFRASATKEMIQEGNNSFFLRLAIAHQEFGETITDELQVGFSREKRIVKINQKTVASHKELIGLYRVMSITEDDISLITGSPQLRRTFIDQSIALIDGSYTDQLKHFKQIIEQRNALLERRSYSQDMYQILTAQLWAATVQIQERRKQLLVELQDQVNTLVVDYLGTERMLGLQYQPKRLPTDSVSSFLDTHSELPSQEQRYGRSLFGAHLDDIEVVFYERKSKIFASRGQQKLLVVLLKIAQLQLLISRFPGAVLLLDDFMTDFDQERLGRLLAMLNSMDVQLIFTSPVRSSLLAHELSGFDPHIISFSN